MSTRLSLSLLLTLIALVVVRADATEKIYVVNGVVRQAIDASGDIRIAHENIPGLMPAMTMAFRVAPPADAAGLAPGDHVRFQLHANGDDWFVSSFVVTGADAPSTTPAPQKAAGRRVREGDAMPEFALLDQEGAALSLAALRGQATVITFIFTRCPVPEFCPAMTLRFGQLQKAILADPALAPRARLLSITLDPEFDRPPVLKAYGEAVGADFALWRFATGTPRQIAALTKAFAVYTERNGITLDHTLCTALIGPDGRVREIWRGNAWKPEDVINALKNAVAD